MQQYKKILGKVMMTPEGTYDNNKIYEPLSLVTDEETGKSYISRKEVPAGIQINNREYWQPVASSGIIDNGVIILNRKNNDGQIPIYDLKSATEAVAADDRKGGVILGFLGFNPEIDTIPTWKLYQYNDVSPSNWTNIDYWLPMDYTNKYAGWFDNEEALYDSVPFPKVGMYAYVGNSATSAIIYRCYVDRTWQATEDKAFGGVVNLADEEDITSKQNKLKFKDKEYNPAQYNGLGRIYIRKNMIDGKNILTQKMIEATNTIYIIQYDYDLQGETITIPEGCILQFEGGSLKGGKIKSESDVYIKGYGFLALFENAESANFVHFENPYHVDTAAIINNPNGSPEKPFNSIQDAANVCNDLVVKCGSVLTVDINNARDNILILKHNTRIRTYGSGNKPIFSGYAILQNYVHDYNSSTQIHTLDLTNSKLILKNGDVIQYNNINKKYFNFGVLHDGIGFSASHVLQESYLNNIGDWYNEINEEHYVGKDHLFNRIVYKGWGDSNFYDTSVSICCSGINRNGHDLHIDGFDFEYIADLAISSYGNLFINNCNFDKIGGSLMTWSANLSIYGNAIESYFGNGCNKSYKCIINNCTISNVYDAGFTIQGNIDKRQYCQITNNKFCNCGYAIEYFSKVPGTDNVNNDIIYGLINANIFINNNSEFNYFGRQRPNGLTQALRNYASAINTWGNSYKNMVIENNIFIESTFTSSYSTSNKPFVARNNFLYYKSGQYVRRSAEGETSDIIITNKNIDTVNAFLNSLGTNNNIVFNTPDTVRTITSASDLNNIKTEGKYKFLANQMPANVPSGHNEASYMEVISFEENYIQRITSINNSYQRVYFGAGARWYNWQKLNN